VSRFRRLSHTLWHCQYHVVWAPKCRFRILTGALREAAASGIEAICGFAGCEVVELNVQPDHVHLVMMVPPKVALSDLLGRLKGQASMRLFRQFRHSSVSAFEEKALPGQSFLGQGILRGHGWLGCGHDTKVCPLPGEEGKAVGAAAINRLRHIVAAQLLGPPVGGFFT